MKGTFKSITNRNAKVAPFSRKQAFYASVCISVLLNLILFMGVLYGQSRHINIVWKGYMSYFFWHLGSNILLFYILFLFNFRITKKWGNGSRSSLYAFFGTILLCILISPILSQLQWLSLGARVDFGFGGFAVFNMTKDIIVSIIVMILTYTIYLYQKREQTIVTNHKLIQENIKVKYESLKNQLDPHFLFNSLNTLNGLVGIDDDKAHDYIDNLSSVFRYTLYSKKVCTLEEELDFVDSYFTLMKIRYGDNLQIRFFIDEKYKEYLVIPVSLQLLVENAIKHNVVSNAEPLCITIKTSQDDSIIVSNTINPKINKSPGGLGLVNLSQRYSIISGKSVNIRQENGEFSVKVPLLKDIEV